MVNIVQKVALTTAIKYEKSYIRLSNYVEDINKLWMQHNSIDILCKNIATFSHFIPYTKYK